METVKLNFYNISGNIVRSGFIHFDGERVITNNGKSYKVVDDHEYYIKVQKTQIKCSGGINGFKEMIAENNRPDGLFNTYLISSLIDM